MRLVEKISASALVILAVSRAMAQDWGKPARKPETIDMPEQPFSRPPAPDPRTGFNPVHRQMDDVIRFLPNTGPATGNTRPEIDDYASVDLTLRADRLRNLFDVDAREPTTGASASSLPYDLPLAGRSLYPGLRYH